MGTRVESEEAVGLGDPPPEAALVLVPGLETRSGSRPEPDPVGTTNSALARAFADLPSYRRANVQGRLAQAGYGALGLDGTWDVATAAALVTVAREASGQGGTFDPSTSDGAAALLDFVDSDRFKRTFLGEGVSFGSEW